MPKTKRKKRIIQEQKRKMKRENRIKAIAREAEKKGFKSAQEYLLYNELVSRGFTVNHNTYLDGDEVDLFIPPKTVIEIGFRDANLLRKWDKFTEMGYNFLYYSNLEIHDASILDNTVEKIIEVLERTPDLGK